MKLSLCLPLALTALLAFSSICYGQAVPNTAVPPATSPAPNVNSPALNAVPNDHYTVPADPYAAILGPEVKILGYGIRPPKDYTPIPGQVPTGAVRSFGWQGAIHQDGAVTTFVVGLLRPSTAEKNPAREFMTGAFQGLSETLTNSAMSASQPGTVGGMPAQRATWTGTRVTKRSKLTMQGFIYVVQDGTIFISIIGADSVPAFTTTFPILNAAALSLHK